MSRKLLGISLAINLLIASQGQFVSAQSSTPPEDTTVQVYRLPKGFMWGEDGAEDAEGNAVIKES